MSRFKLFLFDADNTLFDFNKSQQIAFFKMLEYFKIFHKNEDGKLKIYNAYHEHGAKLWADYENGHITREFLRSERFLYLNRIFDLDFDPENAGKIYLEYLSLEGHLNEDALYVCKKLHLLNIKIGIITNGAEVVQRPRLLQSSLNNYIDFLITSEEAGLPKPHAKIFEMCLERAKINEKKHICIVGDSLNSDIKGGNLFGITTCWYNPFRVRPEFTEDTTPHFIINNLKEILGRI